jgi:two-component system, OmpR family, copper resistance phosphate regulon response regulator CusR
MRILVAEDDAPLAEFLHQRLLQEKFAVQMVATGPEAQRYAADQSYDLVVLDFKSQWIGWSGCASQHSIEEAGAGADDFVAKPFEVAELAARIRAVVRRGNRSGRAVLQASDLELDRITHGVHRQGRQIDLSPKEFSLLELLTRHAGQPVSRPAIVEQVWKLNCDTMTNAVDVYINYLRRQIDVGFEVALIRTIRGVGYQIGANVAPV